MISDLLHRGLGYYPWTSGVVLGITGLLALWRRRSDPGPAPAAGRLSRWLRFGLAGSAAVLAATSWPAVWAGRPLEHWNLWIHVTVAGAFVVLLAAFAVERLSRALSRRPTSRGTTPAAIVALLAGIVTIATMLLSMFPWMATEELERLRDLHRHAGLVAFAALLLVYWEPRPRRAPEPVAAPR